MNKTIITAAMTGAITPAGYNIPESPQEIADQVYECWKLGAAMCHLHMRDEEGLGVMDPVRFYETLRAIRAHRDCDIIINCTSSGDRRVSDDSPYGNAMRMLHFKLLPGIEIGSFDASSFNWGIPGHVFHNSPTFLQDLGTLFLERGIKPEFEVFDFGALRAIGTYWKKGYVKAPLHLSFALGVMGGMDATPECLNIMLQEMRNLQHAGKLPAEITWSAFGIGKGHMPVLFSSIAMAGGIRVGMEDNVVYGIDENGKKIMASNAMLVERAARSIRTYGNAPATPAEARRMLNLPPLDIEAVNAQLAAVKVGDLETAKAALNAEFIQ